MSPLPTSAAHRRTDGRHVSDVGLVLLFCIALVFAPIITVNLVAMTGSLGDVDDPPAAAAPATAPAAQAPPPATN